MTHKPRILAIAGSTRRQSFNKSLVKVAATMAADLGAQVMVVDLADYPMPMFDEDWELAHGLPDSAWRLRELVQANDGLLIASPEYNGSLPAVLKNSLDWLSRPQPNAGPPFENKIAALLSASPGGLGGLRALGHLRAVLTNLGVLVLSRQFALPAAHQAFSDDGALKNSIAEAEITALSSELVRTSNALRTAHLESQHAAA